MAIFVRRIWIEASAETVFHWHSSYGAFERLAPPWEKIRVIERTGGIKDGDKIVIGMSAGPFTLRWTAEHCGYVEGRQFKDVQISGPFAHWEHTHSVEPAGQEACFLEDRIEYSLPFEPLSGIIAGRFVRKELDRLFNYRHSVTIQDLAAHAASKEKELMNILVSGSTGLVGSALIPFLTTGGHRIVHLVRTQPGANEPAVRWDPDAGIPDAASLNGIDAVVHLAGENIAEGRWNEAKKARIRDSRVRGTNSLCKSLAKIPNPPKVLVSASAIGFYGERGSEIMREESAAGTGFLPEVSKEWEAATEPLERVGCRVVHMRIGVVLSPAGGALAKMLPPFRMGVGGKIGSGDQYMSWISLDDLTGAILHALTNDSLKGPVNAVAPQPVTNNEFTKTLGGVLSRPTIFPVPAFAARLAFGEMADALLLSSTRVEPARLIETGYKFRHSNLESALRHLLGK